MDINQISNLNSYLNQVKLESQWKLKNEMKSYTAHAKTLDEWISEQKEAQESVAKFTSSVSTSTSSSAAASSDDSSSSSGVSASSASSASSIFSLSFGSSDSDDSEGGDTKLQSIRLKVYNGKTLTYKEKAYLKGKDPITYSKVQSIETEMRSYKAELRRCRTKEDVKRIKMLHLGSALATVKSASASHSLSSENKAQVAALVSAQIAALNRTTQKFIQKGSYNQLPTEVETNRVEKAEVEKGIAKEVISMESKKVRRAKAKAYQRWIDSDFQSEGSWTEGGSGLGSSGQSGLQIDTTV